MIEIPKNMLGRIWVLVNKAGMDKEQFYNWTDENWGKRSLHQFTQSEINEMIKCLKKMLPDRAEPFRINQQQIDLIYFYARKLAKYDVEAYIRTVVKSVAKVGDMRWLTPEGARKVIEALKYAYRRKIHAPNF